MSLPSQPKKSFFQRKNLEALALPAIVASFLLIVLAASILLPKQKQKEAGNEQKDISYYTSREKVVSEGKTIEVASKILQITPEILKQSIEAKEDIKLVQVIEKGDEWKEPHIKGSVFMLLSAFDSGVNLERSANHIFISSDGYDSAVAINKLVSQGYLKESNRNLEGGLAAWKKKGFPLEN